MSAAGKFFRVTTDIVAIEPGEEPGENRVRGVLIPTGNSVRVVKCPSAADDRLADVVWDGKPVVIFRRDLRNRAREIEVSAKRSGSR